MSSIKIKKTHKYALSARLSNNPYITMAIRRYNSTLCTHTHTHTHIYIYIYIAVNKYLQQNHRISFRKVCTKKKIIYDFRSFGTYTE